MAFMAPHEEKKYSQSYYSENSEEEDMQSAYQLQYVEFLKLREKYKQQVLDLNNLRIEKTAMLIKINDLEERLLETQLQLERVSNEKLIHMLSIQKCPTDKTRLGYVPPSTSDIPSTSYTIFVKPASGDTVTARESLHPQEWIREKLLWMGKYQSSLSLWPSFLSEESLPHAITVVSQGISDLNAHIGKFRGRKSGRLLKLPCVTNVVLAVISDLGVLHLSHPGIIDLRPEIMFQGISSCRSLLKQKRLGSPRSCIWRNRRLEKGKFSMKEHLPSVLSCKI
jgi:hypothetical protein